jgi:ornithine cyclodeaminase/alanine dehydrogenase-like protein (mu-crystallin family)
MPIPQFILYLTESDVQQTLTVAEAVDLAETGTVADAKGDVAGNKFYMDVGSHGFIKLFSGYMAGEEFAYVKTFSYFPDNPASYGRGTTSSMVILFDSETGLPACVMEAGWVTALKTGASSAVTASRLALPDSERVVIFGAGTLGRMHLRALAHRFRLRHASVIDISLDVAARYASELEPEVGFAVEPVGLDDRERAVREADIVFTVTTGDQPLLELDWLRPGAFVGRLGSYQEVALDVITGADKVVVDNWSYVRPRIPELDLLAAQGRFGVDDVYAEWPDIVAGRKPARQSSKEIIVYIALGIWGEYAAILPEVFRRAIEIGVGQKLACS